MGTVIRVEDFPRAKKPAYKVCLPAISLRFRRWQAGVDFGSALGIKQSSARLTKLYKKEDLVGRQVICVTNFAPKNIAGFESQVLITGFYTDDDTVVLAQPDRKVQNGLKLA